MPSAPTVIACLALFIALGGTSYAAITVINAKKLGGKPARDYLLKSGQPLQSSGLIRLGAGKSKKLFSLAGGKLVLHAVCGDLEGPGKVDPQVTATLGEADIYWLDAGTPQPKNTTIDLINPGYETSTEIGYTVSDLTTPQGDYFFNETYGSYPGSAYHASCILDVRVTR